MVAEYPVLADGEEVRPKHRGFQHACCDCGLVHRINFRVDRDGQVVMKFWRLQRSTAALRRHMKRRLEGLWKHGD